MGLVIGCRWITSQFTPTSLNCLVLIRRHNMELQYINIVLAVLAVFLLIRRLFFVSEGSKVEVHQTEPMVFTTFTPSTLAKYDGNKDPRVLLAVKGKVFDVTNGKAFYGPGGPYENFAGHDASRGLAKNSFDPEMITPIDQPIDKLEDLDREEVQSLDQWYTHFENKYPVCGELVNVSEKDK